MGKYYHTHRCHTGRESRSLLERDAGDTDWLKRSIGFTCFRIFDRALHIHATRDAAEDGVLVIKGNVERRVDEELTAVGVGARIGHGNGANIIFIARIYLIVECISWAAGPPARHLCVVFGEWIATLDHESLDDTVEFGAIVETAPGEFDEIRDRIRRLRIEKFDRNVPLIGVQCSVHNFLSIIFGNRGWCLLHRYNGRALPRRRYTRAIWIKRRHHLGCLLGGLPLDCGRSFVATGKIPKSPTDQCDQHSKRYDYPCHKKLMAGSIPAAPIFSKGRVHR